MNALNRLWRLLSQYRSEIRQIYIYAVFIGVVNLTLPLGIQAIINYIQTGEISTSWILLVGFVLAGIAITGLLQVMQIRIVENIQQDLFSRSAFEFAVRLPKISFIELDKIHAPELVNRFFDTLTIQKGLPKILIDLSLVAFQIIFGILLLTIYSPFFIILGIALIFLLWLIFRITGPKGVKTSHEESKYKYNLVHWLEEVARVNRTFKINSNKEYHLERTDGIVSEYLVARENHFLVLIGQFRYFIAFKVIVAAGLLLLGGFLVFQDQMNIGQFVAAEIVIILIINSVEKILRLIDTIYDVLTALEKIGYVTDLKLDKNQGENLLQEEKAFGITGKNIQFTFPEEKEPVFSDLTINIKPKDRIVLKGPSGSGKSVFLNLLSGIYTPENGSIEIDTIPIQNIDKQDLIKRIGITFSVNQLFDASIEENITLGRKVDAKYYINVLNNLGISDYAVNLPKGLKTIIGSGGRRLPRSIIQKIHIARAIVGKPSLLLLEDPLSFIAKEEKNSIIDYIMDEKQEWTVVVISDYLYWDKKATDFIQL